MKVQVMHSIGIDRLRLTKKLEVFSTWVSFYHCMRASHKKLRRIIMAFSISIIEDLYLSVRFSPRCCIASSTDYERHMMTECDQVPCLVMYMHL